MKFSCKQSLIYSVLAALGCVSLTAADTDVEFEQRTPYYEDDAWYDISEWFDGNDYNPTDEVIGKWDDEVYRGNPNSSDVDNDPTSTYSSYGYDDRNQDDNWFYDYYDDGYSQYSDADQNGLYDYSYRFYDVDGDGYYDEYYYYHDTNADGRFDYLTTYLFTTSSDSSSSSQSASSKQSANREQPESAKRQTIDGKIASTKKVSVRGTQHLLVRLEGEDKQKGRFVDLGPASALSDLKLKAGTQISAQGPAVKIEDRRVILAESMTVNGSSHEINRESFEVQGQVTDTRKVRVRDREHLLAVVSTDKQDGKRMVDLGPTANMDMDLHKGTKVTVTGTPVRVKGQRMVVAQSITVDGESYEIDRSEKRQTASANASSGSDSYDRQASTSQNRSK